MADDSSEIVKEQSESVAATNLKSLGDGPAFYTVMQYANATSHQSRINAITEAAMGKIIESIISVSPTEAGGDIAALMQLAKIGQMTPPPTNLPTQGQ